MLLPQVQGKSSGDQYIVFPAHFCTCHYFHYDVVCKVDATHVSSSSSSGSDSATHHQCPCALCCILGFVTVTAVQALVAV